MLSKLLRNPFVVRVLIGGVAGLIVAAFPGKVTHDEATLLLAGLVGGLGLPDLAGLLRPKGTKDE